jgi:hypothetical protein
MSGTNISSVKIRRSLADWEAFCKAVTNSTEVPIMEGKATQAARKNKALADYNTFVQTYFPIYTDNGETDCAYFHIDAANAILADPNILAAIEWPREHAKTVHMCILIPLWLMIHGQLDGMILIGRNKDLAADALADIKAILEHNALLKHDWSDGGSFQTFGDWTDGDFTTKAGIRFLAMGLGQAPQGVRKGAKRPNYALCSDLDDYEIVQNQRRVLNAVNWIEGALIPALAILGSRFLIEGNRIHPNGILATFIGDTKQGRPKREGLYHNKVYATQKPNKKYTKAMISEGGVPSWNRYTVADLDRKFKKVGIVKTKGEYYHEHEIVGRIFNRFQWKQTAKILKKLIVVIGYIDPSFENNPTSDYKAANVWGLLPPRDFICLKRFVRKVKLQDALNFAANYQDDLRTKGVSMIWYIEKQWITQPFRQALEDVNRERRRQKKAPFTIIPDGRKKENKFVRMVNMEPKYSAGEVYFADEEYNNEDMIEGNNQLKGIEHGYRGADDSPDSDEGAWHFLLMHIDDGNFKPKLKKHKRKATH